MDPLIIVSALVTGMVTAIGILYRAILKGDFVPGSIYRAALEGWALERKARERAEERAAKAETQQERTTDALREVTATVKASLDQRGINRAAK